jgi:hypothetical protein
MAVILGLGVVWVALAVTILVAAIRAQRHPRALLVGRVAVAVLFVGAGAVVNTVFLATGVDYGSFADASYVPFVRDTWRAVVAPDQGLFIGLLIVFEAVAGLAVLAGGRWTRAALVALAGFHAALLLFGWGFYVWAVPMLLALGLLLRAERRHAAVQVGDSQRSGTSPAAASERVSAGRSSSSAR